MISDQHMMTVAEWLTVIDRDYLRQFLPGGGASVKVVVAGSADRANVCAKLKELASSADLEYAHVDSSAARLHLISGLFGTIAKQLDWRKCARRFVEQMLRSDGRSVPDDEHFSLDLIAEANDEARDIIRQDLRRFVTRDVFRDFSLSREFRTAATVLCRAVYEGDEELQRRATSIEEWLKGNIDQMSAVRPVGIHKKVARTNARQMLYSTAAWIRKSGSNGMIATIDFSRYVLGKAAPEGGQVYTKAAALDMNEVLRQFIDSVDDMQSCLLVFLTAPEFLTISDRGLQGYEALRLRLTDDVRDRHHPNPLAPMVQVAGAL